MLVMAQCDLPRHGVVEAIQGEHILHEKSCHEQRTCRKALRGWPGLVPAGDGTESPSRVCSSLSRFVVHGIDSIPIWDQALMCLAAAIGCLNTVTLFTWESRSCNGCPETGVLERPDGLGLGYRPNFDLGSVCGIVMWRNAQGDPFPPPNCCNKCEQKSVGKLTDCNND
jgi:hypothetical protein